MKTSPSRIHGFSLIELLVVMLIIGIVAGFAIPATSTILRGSQISQGSQILADQISLARQYSLSRNHPIEVRLIRYADPEVPGEVDPNSTPTPTRGAYRAIQVMEILESGAAVPVDSPALLPQSIIMDPSATFSSLIAGQNQLSKSATAQDPSLPRNINRNYDYVAFRFLPDGSTNLTPTDPTVQLWFVTLHNFNENSTGGKTPNNFFTLQIDPVSGTIKQFRPGV